MTEKYHNIENEISKMLNKFYNSFSYFCKNKYPLYSEIYIRCIYTIYKKWYYSSVVNNSYITPAEIINGVCENNTAYNLCYNTNVFKHNVDFKKVEYSLENHPLVYDMKNLISIGRTGIRISDIGYIENLSTEEMKELFSTTDVDYIGYLLEMGKYLGFFRPMLSIRTKLLVSTEFGDVFTKLTMPMALNLIFKSACEMAYSSIFQNNSTEDKAVNTVGKWLTDFNNLDYLVQEIMDKQVENTNRIFNAGEEVVSYLMEIGMKIDKYFITPFGHYMKLITPFYGLPLDMEEEFEFIESIVEELDNFDINDLEDLLYSPSTGYRLSKMGSEFLEKDFEIKELFTKISAMDALDIIANNKKEKYFKLKSEEMEQKNTISVCIINTKNDDEFYTDFNTNTPLDVVSTIINDYFLVGNYKQPDYQFYKEPYSLFTLYDSQSEKYITLGEFFADEQTIYYKVSFNKNKSTIFAIEKVF